MTSERVKSAWANIVFFYPPSLYLSLRPTNARIWHKAVFKVGPVGGPKPTCVRQGQKYLRPRRHSPFGAPQTPGNNPPRRGYKPGGMAPWGRRKSPVPRHTRQNRPEVRRPTECNPRTGEERPHTNALERPRTTRKYEEYKEDLNVFTWRS